MPARIFTRILTAFLALLVIGTPTLPAAAQPINFTITTQVSAGQGRIETVAPFDDIPVGSAKHFWIRPERGWMIEDVKIDGKSIGPQMIAAIPFVQTNHTVTASFVPFDQVQATNISTKVNKHTRVLIVSGTSLSNFYLKTLIQRNTSPGPSVYLDDISIQDYTGLLGSYYGGRNVTDFLPTLNEGCSSANTLK